MAQPKYLNLFQTCSQDAARDFPEVLPFFHSLVEEISASYIHAHKNRPGHKQRPDEFPLSVKAIPYIVKLFLET